MCCKNGADSEPNHSIPYRLGNLQSGGLMDQENLPRHMLTVQMMMGSVEGNRRNGSIHSRYHGYTTGAHRSDPAIGQANASEDNAGDPLLSPIAIRKPTSTASAARSCGAATRSSVANTGSLKRKLCCSTMLFGLRQARHRHRRLSF